MPTTIHPLLYDIQVHFDPASETITFSGDVTHQDGQALIEVDSHLALVRLTLQPISGDTKPSSLTLDPIVWVDRSGVRVPEPSCLETQLDTSRALTLIDCNTTSGEQRYGFRLSLLYDGNTYSSSDPTIINKDVPTSSVASEGRSDAVTRVA